MRFTCASVSLKKWNILLSSSFNSWHNNAAFAALHQAQLLLSNHCTDVIFHNNKATEIKSKARKQKKLGKRGGQNIYHTYRKPIQVNAFHFKKSRWFLKSHSPTFLPNAQEVPLDKPRTGSLPDSRYSVLLCWRASKTFKHKLSKFISNAQNWSYTNIS